MKSVPSYIVVLSGFLVVSLMIVALAYVWFPESVSGQTFVKVGVSFAVLMIGAVLLSLMGRVMGCSSKEGKSCCPHQDKAGGEPPAGGAA